MKILFLTNSLDYGGIETNMVLLTEEFVRQGDEVHIAARPGPLRNAVMEKGAVVHDLEMRPRYPGALVRDRRILKAFVDDESPDVIHVFSASAALLLLGIPGERVPVVTSIMGLGDHPFEADWRVQARNLLTVQGADQVLLISPAIEDYVRRLPVRKERLARQDVVGIRLPDPALRMKEHRETIRTEMGLSAKEIAIMTTGRLAVRKAHHLFVEAAARVHATHPGTRFFIIGEGPKRVDLEAQIQSLGLEDVVTLLGEVEEVQRYHAAADIYVRPGISEGFVGITVLETQALEIPVVSYDTKDVRLAIDDGVTGRLVPNGDTAAMAQTIVSLLDNEESTTSMARAGRRAVEKRFDITVVAAGLRETYRRSMHRSSGKDAGASRLEKTQESAS